MHCSEVEKSVFAEGAIEQGQRFELWEGAILVVDHACFTDPPVLSRLKFVNDGLQIFVAELATGEKVIDVSIRSTHIEPLGLIGQQSLT